MAKSQLKQNELHLIKLKIVKVVTNLEIIHRNWENIQPQFLITQQFLVFDKRKLRKKIGNPPPPPKRENDVSRDKSIFYSYHVVIDIHTLVKAFSLVHFTICVNLLLLHIILIQICHKFGIY